MLSVVSYLLQQRSSTGFVKSRCSKTMPRRFFSNLLESGGKGYRSWHRLDIYSVSLMHVTISLDISSMPEVNSTNFKRCLVDFIDFIDFCRHRSFSIFFCVFLNVWRLLCDSTLMTQKLFRLVLTLFPL